MAIRTTPVSFGTEPYDWTTPNIYQCTWYTFYRCAELGLPYPCYQDRANRSGSYNNAKTWLANYREPWVVKGLDYKPVAHDIVVFDGEYGHVAFIEKVNGKTALLSQYMSGKADSFSNKEWEIGTSYTGTLLGYLHLEQVSTEQRNTAVNQVRVTESGLRIRTAPNLSGQIAGHAELNGIYNVYSITGADGYTWYEIADERYIANAATEYLPAKDPGDDDILVAFEKFYRTTKDTITTYKNQNDELLSSIKQINQITADILSKLSN